MLTSASCTCSRSAVRPEEGRAEEVLSREGTLRSKEPAQPGRSPAGTQISSTIGGKSQAPALCLGPSQRQRVITRNGPRQPRQNTMLHFIRGVLHPAGAQTTCP